MRPLTEVVPLMLYGLLTNGLAAVNGDAADVGLEKHLQQQHQRYETEMMDYVRWITKNIRIADDGSGKSCIDVVVYQDAAVLNYAENVFVTHVISIFLQNFRITIRVRNVDECYEDEVVRCHTHVLIFFRTDNLIHDLSNWHNIKTSKFLNVVIPFDGTVNPELWPDVFSHPYMSVYCGRRIFYYTTPFEVMRRFKEVQSADELPAGVRLRDVMNFRRHELQVSAIHCPPWHNWIDDAIAAGKPFPKAGDKERICECVDSKTCMTPSGIGANMMQLLAHKLNFSWSISHPPTGEYGTYQSDGGLDGIKGEVRYGHADATICDMWLYYPLNQHIDYVYPNYEICATFIVPRPAHLPPRWYSVFQVFSIELWASIFTIFSIVGIVSWIFGRIFKFIMRFRTSLTASDILLEMVSILVTGGSVPTSSIPGYSFILTVWSVFSLLVVNMYAGNLVSRLTIPVFSPRIDTDEAMGAANLTWGATDSYSAEIFLDLQRPLHQKLMKNLFLESYDHIDVILEHVARGDYAILVSLYHPNSATIIKSSDKIPFSQYRIMRTCVFKSYMGFTFRFNSPYKPAMQKLLVRMFETGVTEHIKKHEIRRLYSQQWQSIFLEMDVGSKGKTEVLGMHHLSGAFMLLALGVVIATLGFIWEQWTYARFLSYQRKLLSNRCD